jgi:hypothetical protein
MLEHTTISFNGNSYDLPLICSALTGANNKVLKQLSDAIITTDAPSWQVLKSYGVKIDQRFDHIDLIELPKGQSSLKLYAARLGAKTLQDLPIDPSAVITKAMSEQLIKYCFNDLDLTELLFNEVAPAIKLREDMGVNYDLDLRSKSDAQIAEAVIRSELEGKGVAVRKPTKIPATVRYTDPNIISFDTPHLNELFAKILNEDFVVEKSGSVKIPTWLANTKINIGSSSYQIGIGGLHSCESAQAVNVKDTDYVLIDADVTSFYPSIILQQKHYPKHLSAEFLALYGQIVKERVEAKRTGNKIVAETYKITLNSGFGKFGSKYSILYSPDLLIQVTLTGQLSLLMLIERLESAGMQVVSANTDGIVTKLHKDLRSDYDAICFDWTIDTSYGLEFVEYHALYSRDVNNYFAIKLDGKLKNKGIFAPTGIDKNPDYSIVPKAVAEYVSKGTPIEKTIKDCQDILSFVKVRNVTGGAMFGDEYLGRVVRFYHSTGIMSGKSLTYKKNGNKVPTSDGGRPIMTISNDLPSDINYQFYIAAATKLLKNIGVQSC